MKNFQLNLIIVTLAITMSLICQMECRKFDRCELAHELLRYNIPRHELATWLCIVEHESSYDTRAKNIYNYDGSQDHGLFQINDRYWCSPGGANVCKMPCASLRDHYIGDDMACVRTIYKVHGYSAWVAWSRHCQYRNLNRYLHGCHV